MMTAGAHMHLHLAPAVCLLLMLPLGVQAAPPEAEARQRVIEAVRVGGYQGGEGHALKLTFQSLKPNPALALFTLEEARAVVAALALEGQGAEQGVVKAGLRLGARAEEGVWALERRVREQYEGLLGTGQGGMTGSLEGARWFQALKLSPRYMGEGVREAAAELFSSPAVAMSVGMGMMLYMMAWAAPEPVFSKALAAAVTIGLLMTYTVAELHNVGMACLKLYREAQEAKTREQLEAVAERFGKALGGVGLRVLVTVAGVRLGRGLPGVPGGGMGWKQGLPRFAFGGSGAGGEVTVGMGARAQVSVADGTVVVMGVTASTTGAAVASSASAARTTGACAEAKQEDNHRHHLCTNKNDISEATGGPWTPQFEILFKRAGMSLDDPANIVYLRDHKGPHPEAYHSEVLERLKGALGTCNTQAMCRAKFVEELDRIAADVCKQGSKLNKLVTGKS